MGYGLPSLFLDNLDLRFVLLLFIYIFLFYSVNRYSLCVALWFDLIIVPKLIIRFWVMLRTNRLTRKFYPRRPTELAWVIIIIMIIIIIICINWLKLWIMFSTSIVTGATYGNCTACGSHLFKSSTGNDACRSCPRDSDTDKMASTECRCHRSFYRSPSDAADTPCTRMNTTVLILPQ